MRNENCIFCRILAGEIPSRLVYEDETFQVIMDADPATKGHCLILPKDHCADLFSMPEETATKVLPLAKKIATHLKETLSCDGVNLVQNNGEAAGQTVHHFHMHVIPRYIGGNASDVTWSHCNLTDAALDEVCEKIRL